MIRYTLNCNNGHQYDSWFSESASFEKLRKKGHLECAICSSKKVEKSLMAPVVKPKKKETLLSKESALEKEIKALEEEVDNNKDGGRQKIFTDENDKNNVHIKKTGNTHFVLRWLNIYKRLRILLLYVFAIT